MYQSSQIFEKNKEIKLTVVKPDKSNLQTTVKEAKNWARVHGCLYLTLRPHCVWRDVTARDVIVRSTPPPTKATVVKKEEQEDEASSSTTTFRSPTKTASARDDGKIPTVVVDEEATHNESLLQMNKDELDPTENALWQDEVTYLDAVTGEAEGIPQEKVRHQFDALLRAAFTQHRHLIESVKFGNIHGLFSAMMTGTHENQCTLYLEYGKIYNITVDSRSGIAGYISRLQEITTTAKRLSMPATDKFKLGAVLDTARLIGGGYKTLADMFSRIECTKTYNEVVDEFHFYEGRLRSQGNYATEWQGAGNRGVSRELAHAATTSKADMPRAWKKAVDTGGRECCVLRILKGKCDRKKCKYSHEVPTVGWEFAKTNALSGCFKCGDANHKSNSTQCPARKVVAANYCSTVEQKAEDAPPANAEDEAAAELQQYLVELNEEQETMSLMRTDGHLHHYMRPTHAHAGERIGEASNPGPTGEQETMPPMFPSPLMRYDGEAHYYVDDGPVQARQRYDADRDDQDSDTDTSGMGPLVDSSTDSSSSDSDSSDDCDNPDVQTETMLPMHASATRGGVRASPEGKDSEYHLRLEWINNMTEQQIDRLVHEGLALEELNVFVEPNSEWMTVTVDTGATSHSAPSSKVPRMATRRHAPTKVTTLDGKFHADYRVDVMAVTKDGHCVPLANAVETLPGEVGLRSVEKTMKEQGLSWIFHAGTMEAYALKDAIAPERMGTIVESVPLGANGLFQQRVRLQPMPCQRSVWSPKKSCFLHGSVQCKNCQELPFVHAILT